jgi:tetratricopeptide (TPR) repeat protein
MKLTWRDFGLLGIIIYFTFIGGTFYSQLNFLLRVANQIIVTVILSLWLLAKLRRREGLSHTYLDLPLAVYLLVNLLSAGEGLSPRFSLETIWFSVVHILAFYLLVDLIRRGWAGKLTWAFYMASAVVCLVGLAEFNGWYVGTSLFSGFSQGWLEIGGWRQPIPPVVYRLNITLNGSTPLSAYLALLIPPAVGLILTLPRRDQNRQALLVWLALALVVQVLTFSRAGILALGVSLTLLAVGWMKVTNQGWREIRRFWTGLKPTVRGVVIAGGIAAVGIGLFWLQRSFANRAGSTNFRFSLWQAAVEIFQDHWLTGAGPANFGRALLWLNDPDLPRRQMGTAHSIYFNTAAELGLIGLIVGGWLLLALFLAWHRRWRESGSQVEQIRVMAVGAALVGLAAQTLVDTYVATPNMLVMLALVAFIGGNPKLSPTANRRPYTAYLALAILLIYGAGLAWIARADLHFQRSLRAEGRGDLPEAVLEAGQAHALDPSLALRPFRLALLEARLAAQTGSPEALQAAVEHYQIGLQQEPILGVNSANLAALLWQQGQPAEATEMLQRTLAVRNAPLYWANLGYFSEQAGDWEAAGQAYGQALALSPALGASGYWQAAPERAARWPDFEQAAVVAGNRRDEPWDEQSWRVELAFARGDWERAEAVIGPLTGSTPDRFRAKLAEIYLNRGQLEQAGSVLTPNPETAYDYRLQGWLKVQQAEDAAAEKLLKTAVFLGDREAYFYLGQLYEQQGDLDQAAAAYQNGFSPHAVSENIPVNIYGRPGGFDLAPQLLRFGVGPRQARAWLALANLYEGQQRYEEAKRIYALLLAEDPYLAIAQAGLDSLEELIDD